MPLLDYTSKVPVSRTVAHVQAKLVEHGGAPQGMSQKYGRLKS